MRKLVACAVAAAVLAVLISNSLNTMSEELDDDDEEDTLAMLQTKVQSGPGPHPPATKVAVHIKAMKLIKEKLGPWSLKKCAAEFLAMTLFVSICGGSAMSVAKTPGSAWVLQVALTFGLCITALAYAIGHYSGGQINCAVTFGLALLGKVSVMQAICNFAAQMLGSVCGAFILKSMYSQEMDCTGGLATNGINEGFTVWQALIGEILGTFLLMYIVLETATDPATAPNRALACVAIGFAVFLAHSVLIPIDGCSINPTRSFGPALVAKFTYKEKAPRLSDHWVFWVGPLAGSAAASAVYFMMSR